MALALKARRAGDPSHRQANAELTPQEARLASLMQRAAQLLSQGADSRALREAIRNANLVATMDSLPWQAHDAQLEQAVETLSTAMTDAGVRVGDGGLPTGMQAGFSFNTQDPRALAWAQSQAASLVREVSDNTRQALRGIIADAFSQNLSVDETITRIQSTVGLTEKGAETVSRLQRRVFDQLIGSGASGSDAAAQALAQAVRMRSRLVKARAQTIARTEILRASNNGRYLGWTQAIESGFAPSNVMKKWSATTASLSGMACERCRPMNGEIVAWDSDFSNGVLMPPAHPNCRCTALMVEPQAEQRKNPQDVTQEVDYSTPAPRPTGVPTNPARTTAAPAKPTTPDVGIPKERRAGMGDIPIPVKDLRGGSADKYLLPDGTFTPERQALHDDIVARHLSGIRSVPKQQQPVFEMLGGGPASGKSTVLKSGEVNVKDRTKAVHINADDIKEMLPEVATKIGKGETDWAAFGHEESSYLAKRVLSASMEKRKHVVLDGTGDGSVDSVLSKVQSARRAGYKVKGTYVTVDTDEAVARATARAKETGRAVPTRVIRDTHAGVSKIFPQVAGEFDEISVVENGNKPIVIAKGVKGKPLDVIDQTRFNNFLGKADPNFVPIAPFVPPAVKGDQLSANRNPVVESQLAEWQKKFPDQRSLDRALMGKNYEGYDDLFEPLFKKYRAAGMSVDDAHAQASGEINRVRYFKNNRDGVGEWEAKVRENGATDPKWEKEVRANVEVAKEKLADAAKNGTVTIATQPEALLKIIKDGRFKSQFETKSSGGLLDNNVRKIGEAGALELKADAAIKDRPIYGFITTSDNAPLPWKDIKTAKQRWDKLLNINSDTVEQYGVVRITLKPDVRERTTFTIGDSLRTGRLADNLTAEKPDFINAGFYEKAAPYHTDGQPVFDYMEAQVFGGVSLEDIDTIHLPKNYVYRQKDYPEQLAEALADAGIDVKVVTREG